MMGKSYSAGGVVVNPDGKVLVVNQNGDSWSLPKGHVDPGETDRQAAEREVREESGVAGLKFIKKLGSYERYQLALGGVGENKDDLKRITLFLYMTEQRELAPEDPHNPEARWVTPQEVADLLTHPKDKAFFEKVLPEVESEC
jgi:8-oxo-dGTP pyrophosphatase MutT (NUDIX family)